MNKEKICLSSSVVELSEFKTYLEMVDRVCYYDAPNLNKVMLPSENADEFAQSLINMPVYAKYRVNDKGEPTFGSHEVHIDEDGELLFDTTPIGVHTSVEIKDDVVTIGGMEQTLPCLFATQRIWTRNKNAVAAIKRLYSEGKLHNSWEICNNAYTYADGVKTITDYSFEGNTLLGYEYANPAYGESAKVISLSAEDQVMVAEALSRDMLSQNTDEEDKPLDKEMNANIESEETLGKSEETTVEVNAEEDADHGTENLEAQMREDASDEPEEPEQPEVNEHPEGAVEPTDDKPEEKEVSALTSYDIHRKVADAARELLNKYCYVCYLFPEEHKALLESEDRSDELAFIQVDYLVNSDDTVTVSNPVDVKLVVSVLDINSKVAELNDTIVQLNQKLSAANDEIAALTPYREAHEKAMHDQKTAELRDYIERSGQFTAKEIESEEICSLIEALDEDKIKGMISDRVVSSSKKETLKASVPRANISADDASNTEVSAVLSTFFRRK